MSGQRLVIACDHALVADAVRVAMTSYGFDTVVLPWGPPRAGRADVAQAPLLGLMLTDLESLDKLRAGQELASAALGRWLLLTAKPKGPAWGAMLESGVQVILPSRATLDETVEVLHRLAERDDVGEDAERQALVASWEAERKDHQLLLERLESLTPRERSVLGLLFTGEKVGTIATHLDISEATVRSHVRSVLRKLGVNSQLAAVAAFGLLQAEEEPGSH